MQVKVTLGNMQVDVKLRHMQVKVNVGNMQVKVNLENIEIQVKVNYGNTQVKVKLENVQVKVSFENVLIFLSRIQKEFSIRHRPLSFAIPSGLNYAKISSPYLSIMFSASDEKKREYVRIQLDIFSFSSLYTDMDIKNH